jgi:hypothetical protein
VTPPTSPPARDTGPEAGRLSLEGKVVQIREDGDERWARVVLTGASVVQLLPPELGDLHLGDRVVLQCAITVEGVRPSPDRREVAVE